MKRVCIWKPRADIIGVMTFLFKRAMLSFGLLLKECNSNCLNRFLKCYFSFLYKLHCRGISSKRVTFNGSLLSCRKLSVYEDTVVKTDETSTYQELDLSENAYHNTALQWSKQTSPSSIYQSIHYFDMLIFKYKFKGIIWLYKLFVLHNISTQIYSKCINILLYG